MLCYFSLTLIGCCGASCCASIPYRHPCTPLSSWPHHHFSLHHHPRDHHTIIDFPSVVSLPLAGNIQNWLHCSPTGGQGNLNASALLVLICSSSQNAFSPRSLLPRPSSCAVRLLPSLSPFIRPKMRNSSNWECPEARCLVW